MTKSIHFILPSGGVRGSFQGGFLYELFTHYSEHFSVHRVDGTSVGALNGIAVTCKKFDLLRSMWLEISNIRDFFSTWSSIPVIGTIKNYIDGFYNNGLYNSSELRSKMDMHLKETVRVMPTQFLERFSCCVMNVSKARSEFIKGDHPDILDYVMASASPWILCNPKTIHGDVYTDGAVLDSYPLEFVDDSTADLIIIVGFDQETIQYKGGNTRHLLYFLASLLDITKLHSYNTLRVKQLIRDGKCIPITTTMKTSMVDFSQENIQEGFCQGQKMAHLFFKTYLQQP